MTWVVAFVVVLAAGAGAGARALQERARRRRYDRARDRSLPDLVELFLVAASAGHPVASALMVVAPRAPETLRPSMLHAVDGLERGLPLADCLDHLRSDLGPRAGPLLDALGRSAALGVALVPLLEQSAVIARDEKRRDAQTAARRLPVTMLFPLAGCILPAAVLLAVVPVLIVSLASLAP